MSKEISIALFHDDKSIVMQDRKSRSKYGERYGFWGGGAEKYETPLETVKRELIEELNYKPSKITYWQDYVLKINENEIILHLFLSPITSDLLSSQVSEGDGMVKFNFIEILTGDEFDKYDKEIISLLISHLKTTSLNS